MSAALISIGVNDYLFMASGGEIRELKDGKCQHDYSCRSSTGMCDKINFMAVSCQKVFFIYGHLWHIMQKRIIFCACHEQVGIYFIEVTKRIICVRL